ncbi:helix-turn-helix domain-containing protein [Brevibacillus daliensis]|uniref:helix-turn-helix domain-containing protein n=1 Tax=Brevibacillus daliensis TaxID=2892995 RepID=UPI001E502D99|nr:helix-turn-helix domain-containing protein [Brevibacillus daliensis]
MEDQNFTIISYVMLTGLAIVERERTVQSLYHMVRGRKASQVLQDVHHFVLYPYYRLFPQLSRESWDEIVKYLHDNKYIEEMNWTDHNKKSFYVTEKGREKIKEVDNEHQLTYKLSLIDGLRFTPKVERFRKHLHLVVQTVSHLLFEDMRFSPIISHKDIQRTVKQLLATPQARKAWITGLERELYQLLSIYSADIQEQLFDQLTGVGQVGMTWQQLAYKNNMPLVLFQLSMTGIWTQVYKEVEENHDKYPLLTMLIEDDSRALLSVSTSTMETYRLLQKGADIQEIAVRRNIKSNTVEDHIIEIALAGIPLDFSRWITKGQINEVNQVSKQYETKRLRLIKDELGNSYTYLQIRLALALKGGPNG